MPMYELSGKEACSLSKGRHAKPLAVTPSRHERILKYWVSVNLHLFRLTNKDAAPDWHNSTFIRRRKKYSFTTIWGSLGSHTQSITIVCDADSHLSIQLLLACPSQVRRQTPP